MEVHGTFLNLLKAFDSLFTFIYINELPQGLNTNVKLFVDVTSLFLVVNVNVSASRLNNDLVKMQDWAFN